ncbi:MAG: hypothetical protein ACI4PO_01595 [Faecousia sp.]
MKKKLSLMIALALILSITIALTGCGELTAKSVEKDPNKQIMESMVSTMEAIFGTGQSPQDILKEAMQKGVITVEGDDIFHNTLAINSDEKSFSNVLNLKEGGQELNLTLYGKDRELAFEIPEMIGEGVYGVNLETLMEDLKDSVLWEHLDISYEDFLEAYEEDYNQFLDQLSKQDQIDTQKSLEELKKELEGVVAKLSVYAKDEEVTVDGEAMKVVNVYYEFTDDDLHDLLNVYIDWQEDQAGAMEELLSGTGSGSYDEYYEEMRGEMDAFFAETDGDCVLTFTLNPKTKYIMLINLSFVGEMPDLGDASLNISVDLGADPAVSNAFKVRCVIEAEDEETGEVELNWERDHNDKNNSGEVTFTSAFEGDSDTIVLSYAWDKTEGDFDVSLEADGSEISVSGKYILEDSSFRLEIDKLNVDGEEHEGTLKLSVAATDGKEVEAMPEYINLAKITEEKLQEIVQAIENSGLGDPYPYYGWE